MRIVSWNTHGAPAQGSDREQERAWHHLASLDADLALLQEVRESTIPSWVTEEWDLCIGEVGVCGKHGRWGSAIAAKHALNLRERPDLLTDGSWLGVVYDYVVAAEVVLTGGSTFVASVHAPAVDATTLLTENLGKPGMIDEPSLSAIAIPPDGPWSTDIVFQALERAKSDRFVIGGDWNTARLFDRDKDVPTNALFFARAVKHGWVEAMGKRNEEQSFFREGKLPYQLDHVFLDPTTASGITSASVWANHTAREISDHAPLVIDLDL